MISEQRGKAAEALKLAFSRGVKRGFFGNLTGRATEEWQRAKGIIGTAPVVGPKTRAFLNVKPPPPIVLTGTIRIALVDEYSKEPVAKRNVQVRRQVFCSSLPSPVGGVGHDCSGPLLFEGITDTAGRIAIDTELLKRVAAQNFITLSDFSGLYLSVSGNDYATYSFRGILGNDARIELRPFVKVTVLSPNGGETLQMGSSYTIRWKLSRAVPKELSLEFQLSSGAGQGGGRIQCANQIPSPLPLAGECVWTPRPVEGAKGSMDGIGPWGGYYAIAPGQYRVSADLSGIAVDQSDAPFTLAETPNLSPYIIFAFPPEGRLGEKSFIYFTITGSFLASGNTVEFVKDGTTVRSAALNSNKIILPLAICRVSECQTVSSQNPNNPSTSVPLSPGTYRVSVVNANGRSNSVPFTMLP